MFRTRRLGYGGRGFVFQSVFGERNNPSMRHAVSGSGEKALFKTARPGLRHAGFDVLCKTAHMDGKDFLFLKFDSVFNNFHFL